MVMSNVYGMLVVMVTQTVLVYATHAPQVLSGQALYKPSITVTSLKLTLPVPSWKKLMFLDVSYHDLLKC
jgi:hypothetical protein